MKIKIKPGNLEYLIARVLGKYRLATDKITGDSLRLVFFNKTHYLVDFIEQPVGLLSGPNVFEA